ncbi:TetR/AcrR family transcriptional regulator [Catenulispora subtropica]|uniref:HTH tetR-type domain-containing protein n=1 Tax=Catenulispora subtropica TaxID=450798 RepID=A0ABP5EGE1_9ACTN
MARPRTPLLSREGIVAAALALVDAEGLDALSTRRLAAELGVSGPSLYNHVATKDELLDAVVDSVVAGVDVSAFAGLGGGGGSAGTGADAGTGTGAGAGAGTCVGATHAVTIKDSADPAGVPTTPPHPPGSAASGDLSGAGRVAPTWRLALASWARSYRAALAAHPNVVPALAQGTGRRPAQLRIADAVFGGLVDAGWPRREATSIGALMRSLVIGSALGSFAGSFPADASVYAGVYPHLDQAHLLAEHQREIDERAFEVGLTAVLDGLELRHAALTAESPPA